MDELQKKTLDILNLNGKVSPGYISRVFKVDIETAKSLCIQAYMDRCREYFYIRRYGMSEEEFKRESSKKQFKENVYEMVS